MRRLLRRQMGHPREGAQQEQGCAELCCKFTANIPGSLHIEQAFSLAKMLLDIKYKLHFRFSVAAFHLYSAPSLYKWGPSWSSRLCLIIVYHVCYNSTDLCMLS